MTFERSVPAPDDEPPRAELEVLVLSVHDTRTGSVQIAIPAAAVREVARVDRITPYPGAPADVPGVAAVRGQIVPVLDVAAGVAGSRSVVLLARGARALALAGGTPTRIVAASVEPSSARAGAPGDVRLWSGRLLPLAGAVRLLDGPRHDAAEHSALPLLDAAALIDDVVDDPEGAR